MVSFGNSIVLEGVVSSSFKRRSFFFFLLWKLKNKNGKMYTRKFVYFELLNMFPQLYKEETQSASALSISILRLAFVFDVALKLLVIWYLYIPLACTLDNHFPSSVFFFLRVRFLAR